MRNNKMKLLVLMLVLLLAVPSNLLADTDGDDNGFFYIGDNAYEIFTSAGHDYIKVRVPAIWHPVDLDTNQVISYLNPIPTYPDSTDYPGQIYPGAWNRSEVAEIVDGMAYIEYMGVPVPSSPDTLSSNNFMYTGNLFFTDRFHRIVRAAYSTYGLGTQSSVFRLEYGEFVHEDIVSNLHGSYRTEYQEGNTLHLYIATREATLSMPEFYNSHPEVLMYTDGQVRDELLSNIKRVDYLNIPYDDSVPNWASNIGLDPSTVVTMYLYDHSAGSFLSNGGSYRNFMQESIMSLPTGEYEAVFPLFWNEPIAEWLSGPEVFARNRYTFSDTFHFPFTLAEPRPVIAKDVEGKETHSLETKTEPFTYNITVNLPQSQTPEEGAVPVALAPGFEAPVSLLEDVLENVLEVIGTEVLVDGSESSFAAVVEGQKISLAINEADVEGLIGKEIVLQITAQIRAGANLSEYPGNRIPNIATLELRDATYESDTVYVIAPQEQEPTYPDPEPYDPVYFSVTVNYYLDGSTDELADSVIFSRIAGSDYDATGLTELDIEDYERVRVEGPVSGFLRGNVVINVYYEEAIAIPDEEVPGGDVDPRPEEPEIDESEEGGEIPDEELPDEEIPGSGEIPSAGGFMDTAILLTAGVLMIFTGLFLLLRKRETKTHSGAK